MIDGLTRYVANAPRQLPPSKPRTRRRSKRASRRRRRRVSAQEVGRLPRRAAVCDPPTR
jgi:hypothetical protein